MIDQAVVWGVGALLLLTPLAVGGVEPWAYAPMEALAFLLFGLWMARGLANPRAFAKNVPPHGLPRLLLPAGLLIGLIAFQLVPLPPALERTISSATYEVYQKSLPGWPAALLSGNRSVAGQRKSGAPRGFVALPTAEEAAAGSPIPFSQSKRSDRQSNRSAAPAPSGRISGWRTLSISPSLTGPALLKLVAYLSVFLLVAAYPFEEERRGDFSRRLARTVILAGLLAAAIALLERVHSNGHALWWFRPYDWPKGDPWGGRAVGSFANPDHLANYLDQVLPLTAVGALSPTALSAGHAKAARWFAVVASVLIASALLLTSSRGGWLGALVALLVVAALWPRGAGAARFQVSTAIGGATAFVLLLILLLLFVGRGGRSQVDARLKETVANESLAAREIPAKATLAIVGDFPIFGVGLGCWPEIFPRYVNPPWSPTFWNATHNDYAQLTSETGLLGAALLLWFFIRALRAVRAGRTKTRPALQLLTAAALGGLAATAAHEFFDFPLQIPANALLFATLLGLTVRLAEAPGKAGAAHFRLIYGLGLIAAIGLTAAAIRQRMIPYPYNLRRPQTIEQAYALIDAYPASARAHSALAEMLDKDGDGPNRLKELRAAVWLDPTNPYSRDLYAQALLEQNQTASALREIVRSVSYSPDLATHFYLERRIVPWLPESERNAISAGFKFAVAHRYPEAVENFASYDDELGELKAEATLYETAAVSASGDARSAAYLENAGSAYLNAAEPRRAEAALRAAITAAPGDSEPYVRLIAGVFGPAKDWPAANALVAQGVGRGADPVALYRALAQGAQAAGNYDVARDALRKALAARPASYDTLMQMGLLDMTANHPDRAANWLRRAAQLKPASADAFSELGRAEESAYEYVAADQAYRRAIALAPDNAALKEQYAGFRTRVAQNSNPHHQ